MIIAIANVAIIHILAAIELFRLCITARVAKIMNVVRIVIGFLFSSKNAILRYCSIVL